ncbi:MAG: hypothetical protein JWM08_2455, partial [Candidatus Angelobacter sp.]|nr:hypothetical protein [Candidatus Angelobacter sp.]
YDQERELLQVYELWFNVRLQLDFYKSVTIVVPSPPQGGLFLAGCSRAAVSGNLVEQPGGSLTL